MKNQQNNSFPEEENKSRDEKEKQFKKDFALAFRKIRKDMHLTQKEFGKKIGVGETTLRNYENAVYIPNTYQIFLLWEMGVDINLLFSKAEDVQDIDRKLICLLKNMKGNDKKSLYLFLQSICKDQ